jgi:hypothetical protein
MSETTKHMPWHLAFLALTLPGEVASAGAKDRLRRKNLSYYPPKMINYDKLLV